MSDPRWTENAREVLALWLFEEMGDYLADEWAKQDERRRAYYRDKAASLLVALTDAILTDPGVDSAVQSRVEWAVLSEKDGPSIEQAMNGEQHARDILRSYYAEDRTARLASRRAWYEPWQPADTEEPKP